jgi:hypothetical protein
VNTTVRTIQINPDGTTKTWTAITPDEAVYFHVNGDEDRIESVAVDPHAATGEHLDRLLVMFIDNDAIIDGAPVNPYGTALYGGLIAGPIFVGFPSDDNARSGDLNPPMPERLVELLSRPFDDWLPYAAAVKQNIVELVAALPAAPERAS